MFFAEHQNIEWNKRDHHRGQFVNNKYVERIIHAVEKVKEKFEEKQMLDIIVQVFSNNNINKFQ